MKYIRTKNGFYGFAKRMSLSLGREPKGDYYHSVTDRFLHRLGAGVLQDKFIIKQADTIEELCDTIAIVWKDHLPTIWNDTTHFKDLLSMYSSYQRKHKIVAIYGAIWTDKGLIYVAKMNDKGELELI